MVGVVIFNEDYYVLFCVCVHATPILIALGPMVMAAKGSFTKPGDQVTHETFVTKSDQVGAHVHRIWHGNRNMMR